MSTSRLGGGAPGGGAVRSDFNLISMNQDLALHFAGAVYRDNGTEAPYVMTLSLTRSVLEELLGPSAPNPQLIQGYRDLPVVYGGEPGRLAGMSLPRMSYIPVPEQLLESMGPPVPIEVQPNPFLIRTWALRYHITVEDQPVVLPALRVRRIAETVLRRRLMDPLEPLLTLIQCSPNRAMELLEGWATGSHENPLPPHLPHQLICKLLVHPDDRFRTWAVRNVRRFGPDCDPPTPCQ